MSTAFPLGAFAAMSDGELLRHYRYNGDDLAPGSAVGSIREIREMFEFSMKHRIPSAFELDSMREVNRALDRLPGKSPVLSPGLGRREVKPQPRIP